jgi:hypothetical protein
LDLQLYLKQSVSAYHNFSCEKLWVLIPTHGEVHLIQLPLCDKFCQIWGGGQFFFSQGILVSSTNKIDHQDKQNNWIIGDRTDQHDIQNHWIMLKVDVLTKISVELMKPNTSKDLTLVTCLSFRQLQPRNMWHSAWFDTIV